MRAELGSVNLVVIERKVTCLYRKFHAFSSTPLLLHITPTVQPKTLELFVVRGEINALNNNASAVRSL
jgi:hypothetical protein